MNATVGNVYKYPMNNGSSVFLIAYPSSSSGSSKATINFTYNLTADYYPVEGMTIQLQAEITPDVSRTGFWLFLIIGSCLGLLVIVIVLFVICCRDFDPKNDFEKRRRKLAKEKKNRDRQLKK